jgi:hypothetical protein
MNTEAKIVGFDRFSQVALVELDIPKLTLPKVREIAQVPDTDPDLLGSYPLTERQVAQIADVAQISVDPRGYSYFLEAYEG